MKRKILSGMMGLSMLGAAASANAFLIPFQGHVGGTGVVGSAGAGSQFDITGLAGPSGFTQTLTMSNTDSVNFSGFGGLGGMTVGASLYANKVYASGFFAYDYDGVTGFGTPPGTSSDVYGLLNQLVFDGNTTTTILSGTAPLSVTSNGTVATVNGGTAAGSFSTNYNGKFSSLPGATGAAISSLLLAGNPVSGTLTVGWSVSGNQLILSLMDSNLSAGWVGFEGVYDALDNAGPNPNNMIDGRLYMANGVSQGGLLSPGNFILLAVPEPASLALLGIGLAGLGLMRRKA